MPEKNNRVFLAIDGMHCDGCVRRVRKLIEMAGVMDVHGVSIGSAEFTLPGDGAALPMVRAALEDAGFTATVKE